MMDMESQVQPLGRNVVLEPQIGVLGDPATLPQPANLEE